MQSLEEGSQLLTPRVKDPNKGRWMMVACGMSIVIFMVVLTVICVLILILSAGETRSPALRTPDFMVKVAMNESGGNISAGGFIARRNTSYPPQAFKTCWSSYIPPCIGALNVQGFGRVWLIQAGSDTPGTRSARLKVNMFCNHITIPMSGRAYFGQACTPAEAPFYRPELYVNMMFLGKVFSYTVDVSSADCGCIVALYLVAMSRNRLPGTCGGDYYCDANTVCGVACAEFDIMEANKYAFRTTAHSKTDRNGIASGLGGQATDMRAEDYHPGSECIDTNLPFQVEVHFPPGDKMITVLSQAGKLCKPMLFGVKYDGMDRVLEQGMTPVLSYWSSNYTGWFDGPAYATNASKMCNTSKIAKCGQHAYLSNFGSALLGHSAPTLPPTPTLPPAPRPVWEQHVPQHIPAPAPRYVPPHVPQHVPQYVPQDLPENGSSLDTDPVHAAIRATQPNCTDPDPIHCLTEAGDNTIKFQ